jgi:hypothetical protein
VENSLFCSSCVFDNKTPGIFFDSMGRCNYCRQIDELAASYGTGRVEGQSAFSRILSEIKRYGMDKKYDCVIGVSGGTDSSYLLLKAIEWGLRPLAVHYDNTWNTAVASENIRKVTQKLNIDLYTYVVDNKEADDIFRSFLEAGVPEFDASTDIAYVQVLRSAAAKYGIKYIIEGHSFIAEGVSPQGKNYFDGQYIKSVHQLYGKRRMVTYPNLTFSQFLKWTLVYRQKFVRPFWYIHYSKREARRELEEKTGWNYYGGHHLENRATAFLHTVYNPQKFQIDNRNWSLSAEVRAGTLDREAAIKILREPVQPSIELIDYVKKRLELSDSDYDRVMSGPQRSFRDFKTYKRRFEILRPMFFLMARAQLVPMSFYLKYCFPHRKN